MVTLLKVKLDLTRLGEPVATVYTVTGDRVVVETVKASSPALLAEKLSEKLTAKVPD